MNIEEACKHIGKEVVLDESTKPYTWASGELMQPVFSREIESGSLTRIIDIERGNVILYDGKKIMGIHPRHLKLKQPNYKIRVTPETSAEVQELFFELGIGWADNRNLPKYLNFRFLCTENGLIKATNDYGMFIDNPAKGITLPELHKLVLDSKNEYGFETEIERHEVDEMTWKDAYIAMANGAKVQVWIADSDRWETINHHDNWSIAELAQEKLRLEPKPPQVKIESPPWEFADMTWKDALRAVADGKDVEAEGFDSIKEWLELNIGTAKGLRLKPQTTHIEGGDYTKEELLKIAGEME